MFERRGHRGRRALALVALLALGAGAALARAEVTATHDALITFDSEVSPRTLPRHGRAPVAIEIEGHLKARKGRKPVPLVKIELGIHTAATVTQRGLPVCDTTLIDPASSTAALEACGGARIGYGRIRAKSSFRGQRNFTFNGRATLFNGRLPSGQPAILIHVFNARPPSSFVFPFAISRRPGRFGTVLTSNVRVNRWSRITDFRFVLKRSYRYGGERLSYLSASCPAPSGFDVGISPFVRATLSFADETESRIAVVSSCRAGD